MCILVITFAVIYRTIYNIITKHFKETWSLVWKKQRHSTKEVSSMETSFRISLGRTSLQCVQIPFVDLCLTIRSKLVYGTLYFGVKYRTPSFFELGFSYVHFLCVWLRKEGIRIRPWHNKLLNPKTLRLKKHFCNKIHNFQNLKFH